MKYFKFTAYLYLAAAIFFAIYGVKQYNDADPGYWLSLLLAVLSIFMFFFRRRFARRYEDRNNQRRP